MNTTHANLKISCNERPRLTQLCGLPSLLLMIFFVTGCGPHYALRDGQQLIATGQYEQGLRRLEDATVAAPGDSYYRTQYLQTREEVIRNLLSKAQAMQSQGKISEAKEQYQQILKLDTDSPRAIDALRALDHSLQAQALLDSAKKSIAQNEPKAAINALRKALLLKPQLAEAQTLLKNLNEPAVLPASPTTLSTQFKKPISIEFRDASVMQIFDVISRTSGLNIIFDKEVRGDARSSIFLKNSTIEAALHFTLLTNQLAYQVLDNNTVLIYPNNQIKQKEYQELVVRTFFLTNANAIEVAKTLTSVIKSKDLAIDEKLNTIIMRDNIDAIRMAEKIIAVQDIPEPEVMLEVEVLEIKRTRLQELGIKFPENISLAPLTSGAGVPLTLRDLTNNINSRTTGVSTPTASVNAKAVDSDVNILANPRIRAKNLETATIQIGERVPNVTTTSTTTFVSESITYTDVGLKLEVQPRVYLDNDVGIRVKLDVSNVVSQSQTKNGATTYQLGTRNAATSLRLKDGETQILAGLINNEDRRTGNKIPLLGDFPIIGRLFGNNVDNKEKTEIVLSITPRLIRNIRPPDISVAEFSVGTESGQKVRIEPDPNSTVESTTSAPVAQEKSAKILSPLIIYSPLEAYLGETFTVNIATQSREKYAHFAYSLKVDPTQFDIEEIKSVSQPGSENSAKVEVQRDSNGQFNVILNPSNGPSFKVNGAHLSLALKPKIKVYGAKITIISAASIAPSGEIVNQVLPSPIEVNIK